MGRHRENARPRDIRPLSATKVDGLLARTDLYGGMDPDVFIETTSGLDDGFGISRRERDRRNRPDAPPNSRAIGNEAKKRIKQVDNVPKAIKSLASLATGFWSSPTAPLVANTAKNEPEYIELVEMMMRAVSTTGSTILSVGVLRDLIDGRPLEGSIGGPFSPGRQAALRLAETTLIDVCGGEDVLKQFELPVPEGIRIGFSDGQGGYRYSYDVRPAERLDVRLASYDYPTVQQYVDSIGGRTLERHALDY